MPNAKGAKRRFGSVRRYRSGRWTASYIDPTGLRRNAPETFPTKTDAEVWLSQVEADLTRGDWTDPDAGAVNFEEYALRWVDERGLAPTSDELYRRLLRLHLLPTFSPLDLEEITPPGVRAWRAERLAATGATTVAKSYRLLKAILQTAADDELIRRNPCRIKGAGREEAEERPIATVEQVDAVAEVMGPRWQLMVYLAAYGSLRPEEQAELRRSDVTLPDESDESKRRRDLPREPVLLRITRASPELTTGRRATGRRARAKVGLPENFRFYDLRHTGNTLVTQSGGTLKDAMVRAGQSSEKAALIYQHSTLERQKEIAAGLDARVRAERQQGAGDSPSGAEVVRPA